MTLQVKRSADTGSIPTSLLAGEPAWNSVDRTLYLADSGGTVRKLPSTIARSTTPVTVNTTAYTSIGSVVVPVSWMQDDECIRVESRGTFQTSSGYIWLKVLWGGSTIYEDGTLPLTHAATRPYSLSITLSQGSGGEYIAGTLIYAPTGAPTTGLGEGGSAGRVMLVASNGLTTTTRTAARTLDIQAKWSTVASGETLTQHLFEAGVA